jgi:hypothetical protein
VTVLAAPLDRISRNATPYPGDMLPQGGTGLCLFAAAFLGVNDSIHMARKDMTVTCVDHDADRLNEMAGLYPDDWTFHTGDAWEFAHHAWSEGRRWDVVSVDTFTGGDTRRSLRQLDQWCDLANRAVTATVANVQTNHVYSPDGWRMSFYPRSPIASWLVLRRD